MPNIISDYTVYILASTVILLILVLIFTNFQHCKCCCGGRHDRRNATDMVRDDYYETNFQEMTHDYSSAVDASQIEAAEYSEINKSLKNNEIKDADISDYYNEGNGMYVNPGTQ